MFIPIRYIMLTVCIGFFVFMSSLQGQTDDDFLNELKNGVLLVQLNTEQKKLDKMREYGMTAAAADRENELKKEHYEIIRAFTEGFDFCPVYFFYADEAATIKEGRVFETIRDENLQHVSIDPEFFLIARFGYTPERGIPGLLVYNQQLEYLEGSFPGFVSKNIVPILFVRSKTRMVELLNRKLHQKHNFKFPERQ